MKLQTYQCNYCPTVKGAANHWWLRLCSPFNPAFVLLPWDNDRADESKDGSPIYEHICSEQCAIKALSKYMASQNMRPTEEDPRQAGDPPEHPRL